MYVIRTYLVVIRKLFFLSRADLGEDGARLVEQDERQAQAQRQPEGNQADAKSLCDWVGTEQSSVEIEQLCMWSLSSTIIFVCRASSGQGRVHSILCTEYRYCSSVVHTRHREITE